MHECYFVLISCGAICFLPKIHALSLSVKVLDIFHLVDNHKQTSLSQTSEEKFKKIKCCLYRACKCLNKRIEHSRE